MLSVLKTETGASHYLGTIIMSKAEDDFLCRDQVA